MAHAQKPDFIFRRNGRVHLNRRGRQFNRLLAAEVCASAVVMLDTPCSKVVWRVLATYSIRQFPLHYPSLHHCMSSYFNWSRSSVLFSYSESTSSQSHSKCIIFYLLCEVFNPFLLSVLCWTTRLKIKCSIWRLYG